MPEMGLDGGAMVYEDLGDGPPILFLHPENGPAASVPFISTLARRHRVIAPTLPGYGDSYRPSWVSTVDDVGVLLLDFMDALGVAEATLIGVSIGGWVALEMAARNASRAPAVVVVNSMGLVAPGQEYADVFRLSDEEVIRRSYLDTARLPDPQDLVIVARADAMTARLGWSPRFHDPKLGFRLHRATMPVLIVTGRHDEIVPPGVAEEIRRLVRKGEITTMERCAHFPHWEAPEELADLVEQFLERRAARMTRTPA